MHYELRIAATTSFIVFYRSLSGSGQVRIIKPVNVHYFHYLFNASLNIVLEAILNEGDDVTNLDHDAYKYSNDMIKLY